jgi:hypothetical protein
VKGAGTNCGVDDGFITVADCTKLKPQLLGALKSDPAFGLFIDIENAGQLKSSALFVCTGYHSECVNPQDPGGATAMPPYTAATVEYQLPFSILEDPCIKLGGRLYC